MPTFVKAYNSRKLKYKSIQSYSTHGFTDKFSKHLYHTYTDIFYIFESSILYSRSDFQYSCLQT